MLLIYIFTLVFVQHTYATVDKIVIKLRPEQVLNTFQSVISSDYLRTLANDFAKKAAEHLINEMKNQEKRFVLDDKYQERNLRDKSIELTLVNKKDVMSLLSEPSPDGDNLEAELVLSDEDTKKTKESRPQAPMKINGAYYKRYFK